LQIRAFSNLHDYLEGSELLEVSDHESVNRILNSSPGTIYSGWIEEVRMALMPHMDNIKVINKPGADGKMVDPISRTELPGRGACGLRGLREARVENKV
jgi:hypothetical protein